ncbi:hypothetical protein ACI6QG_13035 [Roseococcus sp. DSY-14]|uniref:hypothetical protein n=1 Tax=Roseococcus sp. DSY-14 TaxID=3369650 RepID=UPI00387AAE03
MGALTSLATLAGAGASLYAASRTQQAQQAQNRAQVQLAQQQQQAQQGQLALQQEAERRARAEQLARTIAAARARLGAGGVAAGEGSGAALEAGLRADAAAGQQDSDEMFRARLASGRASLLNPDMSLTNALRAVPTFGTAIRSLLD